MRMTLAIEKFDPKVGGAERYSWDFAHFLASRGHEVAVICLSAVSPASPGISTHRLRVVKFPQFMRHLTFSVLHSLTVRRLGYDLNLGLGNVFFMDVYQPRGGVHMAWAERELMKYPSWFRKAARLYRRALLKNTVQRWLEWWVYNVTRPEVIAIADMIREDIVRFYHYPPEKIHLIPNSIDRKKFTRENRVHRPEIRSLYGLAEDDFVFLFVTNNLRLKGFDLLVDVCGRLEGRPFKVLVIGDDAGWAVRQLREQGLQDTVILGGKSSDIEKVYPACDCLVHPTYYDACSRVVLEALASGLFVITTDANGAKMYVDGDNGLIVPAGDPAALAGAMDKALHAAGTAAPSVLFKDHVETFADLESLFLGVLRKKASGGT